MGYFTANQTRKGRPKMTEVRDEIGWRTIDPAPIPPALYDKQDQLAQALSGLLMETQRLRISSDDAVNIALSTVAQVLCHGVPPEFDQDLLRFFAAAVLYARMYDSNRNLGNMSAAGHA
jgi:hypothetical protein